MRIFLLGLLLCACFPVIDRAEGEGEDGEGEPAGEGEANEGEGEDRLGEGETCAFNDDCQASLRCGCVEGACVCETGVRGTGQNGIDDCVDGNDCSSSLCVENSSNGYSCSGPCVDDDDCGPQLPLCADIAFVGRICIRQ
jgi:hypothetical protein